MGTDTKIAVDHPGMTGANPNPPRDKVTRIATMTARLLDEVHTETMDTASLDRLRTIDTHIIDELVTDLTPDLREELQRLVLPLTRHTELSDSELRLAHAQSRRTTPRPSRPHRLTSTDRTWNHAAQPNPCPMTLHPARRIQQSGQYAKH